MVLKYINSEGKFNNIKQVAKEYFHMSDKLIAKLKNKQLIFLNQSTHKITEHLKINDIIEFNLNYQENSDNIIPTKMKLDIVFEDESLLIVDKPPFTPVHPSLNYYENSLSNGVKYYFESINLHKKIRPVNRLDKDTSGLVIFAKNEYIQECLIYQMKTGDFHKKYLAILDGFLSEKTGTISAPIARKNGSIIEREINFENGQNAITDFLVIKQNKNFSLVEFKLLTGRTHQIRVHSKYMSHPILGDSLYGTINTNTLINRQALHAYSISFIHPITHSKINLECKLPQDMQSILENFD